jgi:hypothetical protein
MTEQDVRDLLAEIAKHDGRVIDSVAVYAWGQSARMGNWDRVNAIDAVRAFYDWSDEEPIRWRIDGALGRQRPVLPYDIGVFVEMRRLIQEPA